MATKCDDVLVRRVVQVKLRAPLIDGLDGLVAPETGHEVEGCMWQLLIAVMLQKFPALLLLGGGRKGVCGDEQRWRRA